MLGLELRPPQSRGEGDVNLGGLVDTDTDFINLKSL